MYGTGHESVSTVIRVDNVIVTCLEMLKKEEKYEEI